MQHSKLGASSAYRWTACPGSVALCEQAPEQESSIYAQKGTEAHEWAEKLCLGKIKLEDAPEDIREHIKLYWETTLAVKGQR
ncbi:DUF2800 domain-containing protein, partial [Candidatus Saccharibacteria bacterium]|nr:DUF2800 domain-containing protein [Candidatus Saccharibacteria bacterium]